MSSQCHSTTSCHSLLMKLVLPTLLTLMSTFLIYHWSTVEGSMKWTRAKLLMIGNCVRKHSHLTRHCLLVSSPYIVPTVGELLL